MDDQDAAASTPLGPEPLGSDAAGGVHYEQADITDQYSTRLGEWVAIARRQEATTRRLLPGLLRRLDLAADDPVLELGSGVGQLALAARDLGYRVTASDVVPSFLEHLRRSDLPVLRLDARRIGQTDRWAAIFTQSLSPIVTRDRDTVREVYESVFAALRPGGRFLLILPRGDRARFSRAAEHREIYASVGFVELTAFRQQALPSRLYRYPGAGVLEAVAGRAIGIRDIRILRRPLVP